MSTTGKDGAGMRDRLVEAAVRLLAEEGPAVLQARRLAREVDASTMAVYHYFGGMPQLLAAVVDEGFRRLDVRLAAVPSTDDAVTDLGGLALAYRAAARDNPHLYDLMFGLPASGGAPPGESEVAERAYGHLVAAADRVARAGRIREQEPARAAAQLWSMLHGYVTLELSGHFDRFDDLDQVFIPMATNLIVGLGDAPDRAARSWARIQH
ncbi:TetR/AcrR family transcriptional regulator [Saccharopolyspora sp. NFXS83]|uniref:TetR/AcrR family transcriptional regulator n=1 Tax=Saccharopolyspora sp. NFXS83 TaxID=2993560 RepID=UPI00224B4746|nr:TetR/AcrR family transcriptional regulator [Saccharopolyspora sp. NFXS83]MCX2729250.1 TetR/AcrR family transcriptional regulator [Saccharopolyspora sp. NFXS83]